MATALGPFTSPLPQTLIIGGLVLSMPWWAHRRRRDLANRCELRVLNSGPHADAIPWPGPSVTSNTQPIDLGPWATGLKKGVELKPWALCTGGLYHGTERG